MPELIRPWKVPSFSLAEKFVPSRGGSQPEITEFHPKSREEVVVPLDHFAQNKQGPGFGARCMVNRRNFVASASLLPFGLSSEAFGGSTLFITPAQTHQEIPLGPFQGGEYLGTFGLGQKLGIQIAPTSPQRIAIHVYSGGLPGLGYDGKWQQILKGRQTGNGPDFVADGGGWNIQGTFAKVKGTTHKGGSLVAERIPARSPITLGAKPSAGAKILFDGAKLDAWKRAKKDNDGNLMVGCETVDNFRDFLLHVEFRLPFLPDQKGQDRANSGVYIQNRYEIQILDSFALEGSKNECGSIYEYRAPDVNACLPPGQWQSYDIEFHSPVFENQKKIKNARINVIHNGILIHDHVEIPGQTGYGRKEGPDPGPLHLQNHGSPVVYRNIWILNRN